jgi:hypothetical protein
LAKEEEEEEKLVGVGLELATPPPLRHFDRGDDDGERAAAFLLGARATDRQTERASPQRVCVFLCV